MYVSQMCYKGQKRASAPLNGVTDGFTVSHSVVLEIEPRPSEKGKIYLSH